MIKVNGEVIKQNRFPDGTLNLKYDLFNTGFPNTPLDYTISWYYDSDEELFTIICLAKHLKTQNNRIYLEMPYIPNARMDRVKNPNKEIFTLKVFANIINSLGFSEVEVEAPHSDVAMALIDNIKECGYTIVDAIIDTFRMEGHDDFILFYPDNGAAKRYDYYHYPYAVGMKNRDWETGNIINYSIVQNADIVKDKDVLIIDDICCKGGTFYFAAQALKEAGAKNVYLGVTHCENSIFEGKLLTTDWIKHIYTTDSILTKTHDKITLVRKYRKEENI